MNKRRIMGEEEVNRGRNFKKHPQRYLKEDKVSEDSCKSVEAYANKSQTVQSTASSNGIFTQHTLIAML